MKILAVEFSSLQRSVAVVESGEGSSSRLLGEARETGGRRALSLVDEALQKAKLEREKIECVAIGLGPGSYMGIRGSIALAQGWQLGRAVKLLGISSVEVLAAQAQQEKLVGAVNFAIDAQRNEFYLARYEISAEERRELEPLHLAAFAEVENLLKSGQIVIGPELNALFPSARNLFPDATLLGQLAAGRSDFVSGEKIEPVYLRGTSFKKAPPSRIIH